MHPTGLRAAHATIPDRARGSGRQSRYYGELLGCWMETVSDEEKELVRLDVERTHVDGLEDLYRHG